MRRTGLLADAAESGDGGHLLLLLSSGEVALLLSSGAPAALLLSGLRSGGWPLCPGQGSDVGLSAVEDKGLLLFGSRQCLEEGQNADKLVPGGRLGTWSWPRLLQAVLASPPLASTGR